MPTDNELEQREQERRLRIARVAHEVNRAYCQSLGDKSQARWEEAPQWQRDSAVAGVKFHQEHPCMVPFAELPKEQQAKDFLFRAVVHALLFAA